VQRRRTQIRLAQRAYRNRKETAIQTLEKKVQDLKDTNEEMSNAFMKLYDFAVSQGMLDTAPEFGRQLQSTTEKFLNLARKSSEDNAKEEDRSRGSEHESDTNSQEPSKKRSRESAGVEYNVSAVQTNVQTHLYGGIIVSQEPEEQHEEIQASMTTTYDSLQPAVSAFSYEIITQPTLDNASFPFGMSLDPDLSSFLDSIPTTPSPANALIAANPADPSPWASLPIPNTYSYQERTFGRRLQRTALEQGLALIQMENPPSHLYAAIFGFCLLFEPREKIIERMTASLGSSGRETLSYWKAPFLHLGGAGTFFEDMHQNVETSESRPSLRTTGTSLSVSEKKLPVGNQGMLEPFRPHDKGANFSMGPWNAKVEETRDLRIDDKMRIRDPEFQGNFFDTDEVDYYLQERGVNIPQGADFITVEIDPNSFSDDVENNSPATAMSVGGSTSAQTSNTGSDYSMGQSSTPSLSSLLSPDMNMSDLWSNFPASNAAADRAGASTIDPIFAQTEAYSTPATSATLTATSGPGIADGSLMAFAHSPRHSGSAPNRRRVTVNVEVLIKGKFRIMLGVPGLVLMIAELVMRSVCLGRTPGIRPKDVNKAFWISAMPS
jgi:hypothetical protein